MSATQITNKGTVIETFRYKHEAQLSAHAAAKSG
eukprot:SAG22_NODE_1917_length_3316_cov_4.498912_3_plen_34_part_00